MHFLHGWFAKVSYGSYAGPFLIHNAYAIKGTLMRALQHAVYARALAQNASQTPAIAQIASLIFNLGLFKTTFAYV
jgi:hypothetical protein